jgi:hypothetical protein
MPVKSWPGSLLAKLFTVQSPDAAAQVWANVHVGVLVFLIVVLVPVKL